MTIIWTDKPEHFHTHGVTRLWFDKQAVCYTIGSDNHVYRDKMREVESVVEDRNAADRRSANRVEGRCNLCGQTHDYDRDCPITVEEEELSKGV